MKRVLTAVVFIPFLIWLIWWSKSSAPFIIVVFLTAILGLREFYDIADRLEARPEPTVGALGAFGVLISFALERPDWVILVLAMLQVVTMVIVLARRRPFETVLGSVASTTSGVLYIGLLLGYVIAIRLIDGAGRRSAQLLSLFFLVVWSGDTGAYCVGRLWGKHPLSPNVSPGKTVEGAVGGLLISVLGGVAARLWFFPELEWGHVVALSLTMGGVAILGDLCESMLKRAANLKDSASILPGHGGMLDRLDSLVFNAPIVYYYYQYLIA